MSSVKSCPPKQTSAVWNSTEKSFESLSNFELFGIHSMPLLTESCQPVTLRLNPEFARLLKETPATAFDPKVYGALRGSAKRRFFLIANREGWIGRDSTIYDADAFTIHQLGYSRHTDPKKDRIRRKDRLHSLRALRLQISAAKPAVSSSNMGWIS